MLYNKNYRSDNTVIISMILIINIFITFIVIIVIIDYRLNYYFYYNYHYRYYRYYCWYYHYCSYLLPSIAEERKDSANSLLDQYEKMSERLRRDVRDVTRAEYDR